MDFANPFKVVDAPSAIGTCKSPSDGCQSMLCVSPLLMCVCKCCRCSQYYLLLTCKLPQPHSILCCFRSGDIAVYGSHANDLNLRRIERCQNGKCIVTKSKIYIASYQICKPSRCCTRCTAEQSAHDATQTVIAVIPTYSGICIDDQLLAWHVLGGCCCGVTTPASTWVLMSCLTHHRASKSRRAVSAAQRSVKLSFSWV